MNRPCWMLASPVVVFCLFFAGLAPAQVMQTKGDFVDKFRQLDEVWPTPNDYRNAAGQPGHEYWQQRADYQIKAILDEDARRLSASMQIDYFNNSPDTMGYIWLQLDQNKFREDSMAELSTAFADSARRGPLTRNRDELNGKEPHQISLGELRRRQFRFQWEWLSAPVHPGFRPLSVPDDPVHD